VIQGDKKAIIVDPGASKAGRAQTQAVLEHLVPPARSGEVMVFLTHHHHDHCEALDLIHSMYPRATLLCHEKTLSRVNTKLDKAVVRDGQVLISNTGTSNDATWHMDSRSQLLTQIGPTLQCLPDHATTTGLHVEVVEALGHTEGHMALWERNGRVLVAGDHIVGVGSAVLDAKYGFPHTAVSRCVLFLVALCHA
jgi:glyoxylase-like metal-dependent hydrolase (beta-lactamase superfamily II)